MQNLNEACARIHAFIARIVVVCLYVYAVGVLTGTLTDLHVLDLVRRDRTLDKIGYGGVAVYV